MQDYFHTFQTKGATLLIVAVDPKQREWLIHNTCGHELQQFKLQFGLVPELKEHEALFVV